MAKILSLKISHYRGIENFYQFFGDTSCVVLIGRGDSGKTTILKAISAVLSPVWNTTFSDLDFYQKDTTKPICIESVIADAPEDLLKLGKYGEYCQLRKGDAITSNIEDLEADQNQIVLKVRLKVDETLEPKWSIVSDREIGEIAFAHGDRAKLNMFMISDYVDNHFSYTKGSPLYKTLTQSLTKEQKNSPEKKIIEIVRSAYDKIKESNAFDEFKDATKQIKENAQKLGLTVDELKTIIEFKDNAYSESSISLHSKDLPFRLRGKGSKRLLSIAIQYGLVEDGGIILVDEIEQGLESDRARNLTRLLARSAKGQVFITTHSKDVVLEPTANQIYLMQKNKSSLGMFDASLQGILRAKPEAFFARRIISCEGLTEEGIIRSIGDFLQEKRGFGLAVQGIAQINGEGGDKFYKYAKVFIDNGIDAMVFCDDDNRDIDKERDNAKRNGTKVVLCDSGNSIEQQFFYDLPWSAVCEMVEYAIEEHGENKILNSNHLEQIDDIEKADGKRQIELRRLLGLYAKNNSWYKRIQHGEFLGRIWVKYYEQLDNSCTLKREYDEIIAWIGNDIV